VDKQYLYDLAFRFKKDKIWKKLYDSELYAVRLDDGQIGYCCVLGYLGEVFALTLYVGDAGFDTLRNMIAEYGDYEDAVDLLVQDCIQCSLENKDALLDQELDEVRVYVRERGIVLRGANAFPKFARFKPYCVPWPVQDEAEWWFVARALEITHRLAEYLKTHKKTDLGIRSIFEYDESVPLLTEDGDGLRAERTLLPTKAAPVYPEPAALDDLTLARLKKLKRQGGLECDIVRMPEPVQNSPEQVPYIPAQLMAVDQDSGMVLGTALSEGPEVDPDRFQNALVEMLTRGGVCPAEILVRNEQTRQLVKGLCSGLKIQMVLTKELPALDDALDSMYEHLSGGEADPAEISDQLEEMLEALQDLSDEELRHLPPFIKQQLLSLDEWGMLPEDIAKRLR